MQHPCMVQARTSDRSRLEVLPQTVYPLAALRLGVQQGILPRPKHIGDVIRDLQCQPLQFWDVFGAVRVAQAQNLHQRHACPMLQIRNIGRPRRVVRRRVGNSKDVHTLQAQGSLHTCVLLWGRHVGLTATLALRISINHSMI